MGFDLYASRPKDEDGGSFHTGAFSWHWMLEQGIGMPIGMKCGLPGQGGYVYKPQAKGGSPGSNDGYKVNAAEARCMANAADAVASFWEIVNKEHSELPEHEQKLIENDQILEPRRPWPLRNRPNPVREDFIEKTKAFAKFARQSGGFKIH